LLDRHFTTWTIPPVPTFTCVAFCGLERLHRQSHWIISTDCEIGRSPAHSVTHATYVE
jgi:hypothetical protein